MNGINATNAAGSLYQQKGITLQVFRFDFELILVKMLNRPKKCNTLDGIALLCQLY